MNKTVKILVWIVGVLILGFLLFKFVAWPIMKNQTKKHSPETEVHITVEETTIDVYYCSPSKKDRLIFGELVPYDEVWRTGANEPTRFVTNTDLTIGDQSLPAGEYTLWTLPGKDMWEVMFNSKMYEWGVSAPSGKASRETEYDVVVVEVPPVMVDFVTVDFTIELTEVGGNVIMDFRWDQTAVPVTIAID
ncbi:DUF2911 domain-containing protein [Aureitalea marina]|uniref:DUF2911 domain-containing protein n=1 Tax=Aureitalea marina TaxID=930804 RepID=A0A2S7KMJ0_9FLAO|nr:DUF2911 domain-containing protein [Aureitalea marina]PQB03849.1 hypothetical protein BST85_02220 [Aureitalea marina]